MKEYNLHGLTNVNVELTNRCNKSCWMCGRRKVEREYPELTLKYGDMGFELVKKIASQLPPNIVVQLHNNGEALLYPKFGEAVKLFKKQITNIVTNGKLLVEKADEIIDNLDTLSISIFEKDAEADTQHKLIEKFFKLKGDRKPYTTLRLIGRVSSERYQKFDARIIRRTLHSEMGSFNYLRNPTIPEIGICWDFLHHLAISKGGKVSICVRFDPKGLGVIGDVNTETLAQIWNSKKRMEWMRYHVQGKREKVPLCSYCHYWGVPTSSDYQDPYDKIEEKEVFNKNER